MKKSRQETIHFTEKDVAKTLERLKSVALEKFGPTAKRNDFYTYLVEVYRWMIVWKKAKKLDMLRDLVAKQAGIEDLRSNSDAFLMVISETCPRPKKTKSKYAIALSNAARADVPAGKFQRFLEGVGGPTALCVRLSPLAVKVKLKKVLKSS